MDALTKNAALSCQKIGTGSREQGRQWRSTRRRYRAFNAVHRTIRHPRGTQRIVEYREANGPFASVEGLLEVKGLGPGILEAIRPQITAEEEP